ncbi:MAG: hypothetical protein HUU43_08475 [Ignavibacteriaceae bacterium]|nr:hypothetical protein [Ignavibacteriaceae bacterium]NUM70871.1 hypothetical protein [Ignavibacteriaceae bacterium]
MPYFIGMDGGGTKTHCVVTDELKNILYECRGGHSNFLMFGVDTVTETIISLLKESRDALKFSFDQVESVVLGTTGAGRRNDAERLENNVIARLKEENIVLKRFRVESDARIALEAAFPGMSGSIIIAGTGSIMFGKDAEGRVYRVGGFGRHIGDEGSGTMIGKKGLIAVARALDLRGEPTLISELVKSKIKVDSVSDLITEIYTNNFDIASAAPVVIEAAEKGDAAAQKILDEESSNLVIHISAMMKQMKTDTLRVSFIGGVITNDNHFSRLLMEKIKNELPGVEVVVSENSPAFGAVIMAMELVVHN